ncbi:MAG: hypothetical protein KGZ83_08845 [Sulfuricella sp.]|nr:hypothetical protein [Sulfuricella sp.]
MPPELPPEEDNSEVLEKLDALMRKHQAPAAPPPKPAAPAPAILAPTLPKAAPAPAPHSEPAAESDNIPTLTDVVEEPLPPSPVSDPDSALRTLEERLHHELETRIAPQLSLAFQQALDQLLQDAKQQISATVREHLNGESSDQERH